MKIVIICDFNASFLGLWGMSAVSIANFVVCFWDHTESTSNNFLNFTQNLMLIHCSKN
jgi:hypothetical protein